ncbi:MAG: VOC family protein [Candidatus Obscuribacterales bacterium]|nr:VOC family protein [Candidatus Obscuribacterales bacterium]
MTKPIPDGYHTLTPSLTCKDAAKALEFYKKAFNAELHGDVCYGPDGKAIMHAEMKIGDSIFMLNDEFSEMCSSPVKLGGSPVSLYMYVKDVDTAFAQAVKAGATADMPVTDMFWGDRFGALTDPFGHKWSLATHVKDMTAEEIQKAKAAWEKEMCAASK